MDIEELLADRKHGSTTLFRSYLQLLCSNRYDPKTLTLRFKDAFPDMAVVQNGVEKVLKFVHGGNSWCEAGRWVSNLLDQYDRNLVTLLEKEIKSEDGILTISHSGTLSYVLSHVKFGHLYVMESLPGGEGLELYRSLPRAANIELIEDHEIPWSSIDKVVVSCDAVNPGQWFVNKVGTGSICTKPTYIMANGFKVIHGDAKVHSPLLEKVGWRSFFTLLLSS